MIKKCHLGSGDDYKKGYVNVDNRTNIKTDVLWDLNKYPYPFSNEEFDEVYSKAPLTCLDNPIKTLKEMARITKKNGKIILKCAYFPHSSNYAGLIHSKNPFNENTFIEKRMKEYSLENDLKLISCRLITNYWWKNLIPFRKYLKIFIMSLYDEVEYVFEVLPKRKVGKKW